MKAITKIIIYLQMTALCLTAAFAGSGEPSPFHGTVAQVEAQTVDYPAMSVVAIATGQATKLGRFIETGKADVNLLTGSATGSATFEAANGDTLSTTIVGQGTPTDVPGQIIVTEEHTIAGGTGRFEAATGSFTVVRLYYGLLSYGSFEGTIILAHGK